MRALGYIRVSGRGQVEKDGPARQAEAIAAFCKQCGVTLAATHFEAGVSGTVEGLDRDEFVKMVEAIELSRVTGVEAFRVDAIVVERMDRLARDLMVQELIVRECRDRDIKLFAADQGTLTDLASDTGDPTRTLIRQVLGALAQWDKAVIVKKLHAARIRVGQATGRCEGAKPYGHTPEEARVKAIMLGLYESGETVQRVVEHLNEAGHLTRFGKQWTWDTVYNILTGKRLRKGAIMK